jgi:hypothetical protein
MIRVTAVAVINASVALLSSAVSIAGETPVWISQAAEPDHAHEHLPATGDTAHQHGGTGTGQCRSDCKRILPHC